MLGGDCERDDGGVAHKLNVTIRRIVRHENPNCVRQFYFLRSWSSGKLHSSAECFLRRYALMSPQAKGYFVKHELKLESANTALQRYFPILLPPEFSKRAKKYGKT